MQPCMEVGNITISQPTSSLLVFVLVGLTLWASYYFYRHRDNQKSRSFWALSLLPGGIAACLAGISYQAFGYMLKCEGRDTCVWTNYWEVIYNILTLASALLMLIAVSYSSMQAKWRKVVIGYACLNWTVHFIITLVGVYTINKFLLSFELLMLFTVPNYLFLLIYNGYRYFKTKDSMELALLGTWVILFITFAVYYFYLFAGYTQILWEKGIWFDQNDVLHVVMVFWTLYVPLVVAKKVKDRS